MSKETDDDAILELELAKIFLTNDVIAIIDGLTQLVHTAKTMDELNEGKAFIKKKFMEMMEKNNVHTG